MENKFKRINNMSSPEGEDQPVLQKDISKFDCINANQGLFPVTTDRNYLKSSERVSKGGTGKNTMSSNDYDKIIEMDVCSVNSPPKRESIVTNEEQDQKELAYSYYEGRNSAK